MRKASVDPLAAIAPSAPSKAIGPLIRNVGDFTLSNEIHRDRTHTRNTRAAYVLNAENNPSAIFEIQSQRHFCALST